MHLASELGASETDLGRLIVLHGRRRPHAKPVPDLVSLRLDPLKALPADNSIGPVAAVRPAGVI